MSFLPPELVIQILEAAYQPGPLHLHPDTTTLSNAALVCTSWAPLAQRILFREVVLIRPPQKPALIALASPGLTNASSAPPHASSSIDRSDKTPRVTRAAYLRALSAAATPPVPTPRSARSTRAFLRALDRSTSVSSHRAWHLPSLVGSLHVLVAPPDCPSHFGEGRETGAISEHQLSMLFSQLRSLSYVHIVLDRVDSLSPDVMNVLRTSSSLSTLSICPLKRSFLGHSFRSSPNTNSIGLSSRERNQELEQDPHTAVFQLVQALAPNLETLILDGELPRDPPRSASDSDVAAQESMRATLLPLHEEDDPAQSSEPAPDCALRALIWRGRLPPSPALLVWLLSAKAKGRREKGRKSKLELLELTHLPPPDALTELLREHGATLRSLRLHYFDSTHVNVVRQFLPHLSPASRLDLSELVLNKPCTVAPDLLLSVPARYLTIAQPSLGAVHALEERARGTLARVTIVDGESGVNERMRAVCEAQGVTFESITEDHRRVVC